MNKLTNSNNKKILFLTFYKLVENNGISDKIKAEYKAFKKIGLDCHLGYIHQDNNGDNYIIDNEEIIKYGNGFKKKLRQFLKVSPIYSWIKNNKDSLDFIYVRYTQFANPITYNLFKKIRKLGIKIVLEIPTYPYDKELTPTNFLQKINYTIEKKYRQRLFNQVFKISTFSQDRQIAGIETINIVNAIDFDKIPLRLKRKEDGNINLIGVASIDFWHGFDRIIEGLKEYYSNNPSDLVTFKIIGGYPGNKTLERLKNLVNEYHLDNYISFLGYKTGKELDNLFNDSDIAIGSLGRHRTGIHEMQSLKNMEYCVRGIPFIYSEKNSIFDNQNFILKIPEDDSPINIKELIQFYIKTKALSTDNMRNYVVSFTWENQMKKIYDKTKE